MLLGLGAASGYEVERSLRFNHSDTTYLQYQPSSDGNRQKWTWSGWVKRVRLGSYDYGLFTSQNDGDGGGNNGVSSIYFGNDDKIHVYYDTTGANASGAINDNVYRDTNAWYHIVWQVDAANSTSKIFVNGVSQTIAVQPVSGYNYTMNQSGKRMCYGIDAWDLYTPSSIYLAECHFSDGQLYNADVFAETDSKTGQWVPKKSPSITYGTNGHYLNFSDNSNTTATTLGKDYSGNGNNFTPNNFSVAAGAGNDSVTDSPTNNFCTFSPLKVNASNPLVFSNGNLQHNGVSGDNHLRSSSTMQVNSGKWYVEFKFVSGYEATNGTVSFGLTTDAANNRASNNDAFWYQNTDDFLAIAYRNNGKIEIFLEGSSQHELTGLSTFVNGDVMGLALDLDNDKLFVSKNGTWFSNGTGTQDPANGTNPLYSGGYLTSRKSDGFYFGVDGYSAQVVTADFGQQGYAYTPPSGFKKVCTANLPVPNIKLPNKHFDILTYTGTDTSASRTLSGLNFSPDWVWQKRKNGTNWHTLMDQVRGVGKTLFSNDTSTEVTNNQYGYVSAFTSDGYTWSAGSTNNSDGNETNGTFVSWNWNAGGSTVTNDDGSIDSQVRANTTAGVSIVTYTGTGSDATVGHGLGVAPKVISVKCRNSAYHWRFYFTGVTDTDGKYLGWNSNIALTSGSDKWNGVPTSTVFGVSGDNSTGGSFDYVAYCFSEVAGYSKFGSYAGNGSADGTFVFIGFRPAFVLIKSSSNTENWYIIDNNRPEYNGALGRSGIMKWLKANTGDSESQNGLYNFLSNGFKLGYPGADTNGSGRTYIYLAFAESPFRNARAR